MTRACFVFALAYLLFAELGYALSLGPAIGGTFWPPSGLVVAVLLATELSAWRWLVVVGLVANVLSDRIHGQPATATAGYALANLLDPVVGAYLLRRIFGGPIAFRRVRELVASAIVAGFVSAPLASIVGGLSAAWWSPEATTFGTTWRTWSVGNAVGTIVLAPFVARVFDDRRKLTKTTWRRGAETIALGLSVLVVTHFVFSASSASFAYPFLVFPVLLWASLRFGLVGVGFTVTIVVALATHRTVHGQGPFSGEQLSSTDRLVSLQLFAGVLAFSFNVLALIWEERSRAAERELEQTIRKLRDREQALSLMVERLEESQVEREGLLEAERAARSDAQRASRLKDEFLAMLSHELRTPLSVVLGWVELLKQPSVAPETLARAIETIERNARAQTRIVDDLLDMSRIIEGKLSLTFATVSMLELVSSVVESFRPAAEKKNITLTLDVGSAAATTPPQVHGDAARLLQVATNVVGNAIKFTPKHGRVDVKLEATEGQVRLVVSDSGQGIPAAFLPVVFDRFRQADSSLSRQHGGLGLGLAISKHLLETHGGSIRAESAGVGLGATFTVSLPRLEAERDDREVTDHGIPSMDVAELRVLVVDDQADVRELIARILTAQGCTVRVARSAREALEAFESFEAHVLVSDIGMPDVDGFELISRVRALPQPPARAVALTAFARPEDRERCLGAGFDDHVSKPIDVTALLRAIARTARPTRTSTPRSPSRTESAP